jgi:hypothetical protein
MSESTQDVAATAPETTEESFSDILDHLPPEVAQALGKSKDSKGKSEPDPTDDDEPETTDAETETDESDSNEESKDEENETDDKDESEEEADKPKGIEKLEKRIDKLTRRRKEAESAAESLRAENETLKTEVEKRSVIKIEPTVEDPLADLDSMSDLDAKVSAAKKVRAWALANPDGATVTNPDGSERYVDRSEIAKFVAQTDALLTDHAPARKEYLAQREVILPEAKATYPDLFKVGTEAHKVMVDTLKQVPALKRLPGYEMVIGDALLGMQYRLQAAAKSQSESSSDSKSAAASKGSSAKPNLTTSSRKAIAPAIPKSSASRPPAASSKGKSNRLDRVISSGSMDDLTSYFGG